MIQSTTTLKDDFRLELRGPDGSVRETRQECAEPHEETPEPPDEKEDP